MGLSRVLLCRCNFIVNHETVTIIRFHKCEEKHATVIIFRNFSILNFSDFGTPPPPLKHTNPTHTPHSPHIHIIKSWPDILTIFTVFTQYRFESLWAYVIDLTH